jgi:two-component system CheB/CheR fusion protein
MNKLKKEKIKEIMDEIISLFNQENERKNLIIETNIEDELPFIFCQKNQLKQAFLNLIQNAQEAMEETNGKLLITAKNKKEKKQVHITFKDNGKGISPERLEKLGEPFFTTKEKGIGLGTTISYKIIKQHKGTIHFESEPGKGTTVRVILPYD